MSNVIKNYGTPGKPDERFEMNEIEANCEETLEAASVSAEAILERATRDAETIRDQAYRQGWEAGRREAYERLDEEIRLELGTLYGQRTEEMVQALREVIGTLDGRREGLVKTTRNDLVKLAMRIARVIVKKEVTVPGEVAALNLEECIRQSAHRTELVALVSQQDVETLKLVLPRMEEIAGTHSAVKLVADPMIAPGGCLVRSESGEVDGMIETQLAEIERVLLGDGSER